MMSTVLNEKLLYVYEIVIIFKFFIHFFFLHLKNRSTTNTALQILAHRTVFC